MQRDSRTVFQFKLFFFFSVYCQTHDAGEFLWIDNREFKNLPGRRRRQRDTLKSFTLFITLKLNTTLNLGHREKFEKEFKKLAVEIHVLQTTQNLVISAGCCIAEDSKEMYKDLQRTCIAIVLLIKPFV